MGGWLNPSILFIMRRLLTATLMAASSIASYIPNQTTFKNTWDAKSQWQYEYTGYNGDDAVAFYRQQKGQYLYNGVLEQQQKLLEFYLGVEDNIGISDVYILTNVVCKTYEINTITNSMVGVIGSHYQQHGTITYQDAWLKNDPRQILQTWLTTDTYTTASQLVDVVNALESAITDKDGGSSREITDWTDLNYGGQIYQQNLATENNVYLITKIHVEWATSEYRDWETPITSFDNIYQSTNTMIQYEFESSNVGEVVDIPGIMFTILGMPFAFVSQSFNLTIFPGTPYSVNLSHIFLALISAAIIIFIIKKVVK